MEESSIPGQNGTGHCKIRLAHDNINAKLTKHENGSLIVDSPNIAQ